MDGGVDRQNKEKNIAFSQAKFKYKTLCSHQQPLSQGDDPECAD